MTEEEKRERPYPLRSLHDFLSELDREWSKFRTGALISMIASGALLVFYVPRLLLSLLVALRRPPRPPLINIIFDIVLLVLITALLIYSIYAMTAQYRFFSKWERRIGLLLHLEEKLIGEKLEEKSSE
ncbi:MAG: hypothetical protein ACE5IF_03815 [Candidatus Bathyarchaeia archaeon]